MPEEDGTVRSVLIIDDDVDFAESLADTLQTRGYAAHRVQTPEQALAALREGTDPAPVALIDLRLGGIASGVDLIPRLQAEQPELICVLMTAQLDSETAIEALRRGAYDYFDKPRGPTTLFALLDRCFDRVALLLDRPPAYQALRVAKDKAEAPSRC